MRTKTQLRGDIKNLSNRLIEKNLTIRYLVKSLKRLDQLCIIDLDNSNPELSHRQTINKIHSNINKILKLEELQSHMYHSSLNALNNRQGLR